MKEEKSFIKIKAKNGKLKRVPGGLSPSLVEALMSGEEVEVLEIHPKLVDLVEEVSSKKSGISQPNKVDKVDNKKEIK
tara:strand:- start:73 stop:306 length:234 start_codon:yes stop_codon:yes gene_type:complete